MTPKPVEEMSAEELREEIARLKRCPYWRLERDWTTDIVAAWRLVEEMKDYEPGIYFNSGGWWCEVRSELREAEAAGWMSIDGNDPTAPLAICRAYVQWKRTRRDD